MSFLHDYTDKYYFLQDSLSYRAPVLNCDSQDNLSYITDSAFGYNVRNNYYQDSMSYRINTPFGYNVQNSYCQDSISNETNHPLCFNSQYTEITPIFMTTNNNFGLPPVSLNVKPLNFDFSFMNNTNWCTPQDFITTFSNIDTFTYSSQTSGSNSSLAYYASVEPDSTPDNQTTTSTGNTLKIKGVYSVAKNVPAKAKPYYPIIQKYAKQYKVPEELVLAVMTQESQFNPKAGSDAGAKGLMQLMPGTAKDKGVTDVYDPDQNIRAGVEILSKYIKQYDGDLNKILIAYNAGPGNLQKYLKGQKKLTAETIGYIPKVTNYYKSYSNTSLC